MAVFFSHIYGVNATTIDFLRESYHLFRVMWVKSRNMKVCVLTEAPEFKSPSDVVADPGLLNNTR